MSKNTLHSLDVALALQLLEAPDHSYAELARDLVISSSTAHQSVQRLLAAGLVRPIVPGRRRVNRRALLEFLTHGVRYAFPTALGPVARGVATAHSGPALQGAIVVQDVVVWPASDGGSEGPAIEPLWPKAAQVARLLPRLYAHLTAVDALRIGRARERHLATAYLTRIIMRPQFEEPVPLPHDAEEVELAAPA